MITAIRVKNFKSFKDFKLEGLDKFTCIIGLNGSGKSTFLEVLEWIGRLAHGEEWFWLLQDKSDFLSFGSPSGTQIEFTISFQDSIVWEAAFDVKKGKLTFERIMNHGEVVLSSENLRLDSVEGARPATHGSLLAHWSFDPNSPADIVKKGLQSLKNLGLLSPALLCERSGQNEQAIYGGGRGFAGFLSTFPLKDRNKLLEDLHRFYPDMDYYSKRTQGGGKYLRFKESGNDFSSKNANDGLLRTLAILSQRHTSHNLVLFDEIENGFNQELIEKLVNELLNFNGKQVIITTHSAGVINYLPDETARRSVILFYKDGQGYTQATRFFEIPEISELLEIMGPGQVMSRTNLEKLSVKLSTARE